jgi:hypothetical protein
MMETPLCLELCADIQDWRAQGGKGETDFQPWHDKMTIKESTKFLSLRPWQVIG